MQPLLKCGPFIGLNATKEAYWLDPGYGATATNVDVSFAEGAFSTAAGRNVRADMSTQIPAGYTIQAVVPFIAFSGENPPTAVRVYVFSAVQNATDAVGYQGWFNAATLSAVHLTNVTPFTQAVQFGSALWTNSGWKITFQKVNNVLNPFTLSADVWQSQLPVPYAYNLNGTYVTTTGNAAPQQYQYAVTLRRAAAWNTLGAYGGTPMLYSPDLDTYQETSPLFSTQVTTATGQQPALSVNTAFGSLASLVTGLTIGGETYYGALYRWSTLSPAYQFVDYLVNLTQGTGNDGNPCFIDTHADADIQSNALLNLHHDPPPMIGQVYPGPPNPNGSAAAVQQQNQQVAFTYQNPAFIAKHKNRMWAFTLYPTQAVSQSQATGTSLSFQPQLWCSDYASPWSFNDDASNGQVLILGSEDTPGNFAIDGNIATSAPWKPGLVEDVPMGLARAGSILVAFKSQSTWIVMGDSPAEFLPRNVFDIGCIASSSIAEAEGGVFWLAPQGVYFFSGGEPSYISEDVRGLIESLPWAQRQAAVGSYSDRTFYLSFANITLCYYTPSQKWYTLPYGATAALYSPYNQNQLVFVNGNVLQQADVNVATDLGQPIVATWQSAITDSGAPGQLKQYSIMQIVAPQQAGTVVATLSVDAGFANPQTFSWKWDLSLGNGALVQSLPPKMAGYSAQLTLVATTAPGATSPLIIRAALVMGDVKHGPVPTTGVDGSGVLNGVLHG